MQVVDDWRSFARWKWFGLSACFCLLIGIIYLVRHQRPFTVSIIVPLKLLAKTDTAADSITGTLGPADFKFRQISFLASQGLLEEAEKNAGLQVTYPDAGDKAPVKINVQSAAISDDRAFAIQTIDQTFYELKSQAGNHVYRYGQLAELPGVSFLVKKTPYYSDVQQNILVTINSLQKITDHYKELVVQIPAAKDSSTMHLQVTDTQPERAAALLTAMARLYQGNQLNTAATLNRIGFINRQLDTINQDLVRNKERMEKKVSPVSSTPAPPATGDKREIQKQLDILKALEPYVNSPIAQFTFVPNTFGLKDVTLNHLINELNETELERQQLLSDAKPNATNIKHLSERADTLKKQTMNEIYVGISRIESVLPGKAGSAVRKADPAKVGLQNEQQAKVKLYLFLMNKREQLRAALPATDDNILSLSTVTIRKDDKGTLPVLLLSLFAGLLLPVLGYAIKQFAPFRYQDDHAGTTTLPVIDKLVNAILDQKILMPAVYSLAVKEEMQRLASTIKPLAKNKMVTIRSLDHPGKPSLLSINLAIYLARFGEKVLIIRTGQTKQKDPLLNTIGNVGLNDYLSDRSFMVAAIIQTSEVPNLAIIEAGTSEMAAADALRNERFDGLLTRLKTQFNFIFLEPLPETLYDLPDVANTPVECFFFLSKISKSSVTLIQALEARQQISKNIFLIDQRF